MYGTGLFTGGGEFSKLNVGLPVILSDMFFKFCHKSRAGMELWVGILLVNMQVKSCIHIIIFANVGVILFIAIISIEIFPICVKNTIKF